MIDALPRLEIGAQTPPITPATVEAFTPTFHSKFQEAHGMPEEELIAAIPKIFVFPEQTRNLVDGLPMPDHQTGRHQMAEYRSRYAKQIEDKIPTKHQEKRQAYTGFLSHLAQFAQYQLLDARASDLSSADPSLLLDRSSTAVAETLDIALHLDELKTQNGDQPISLEGSLAKKNITGLTHRELGHLAELIGLIRIGMGDVSFGATLVNQSTELTRVSKTMALDRSFLVAEAKSIYQLEHPLTSISLIDIITSFLKR